MDAKLFFRSLIVIGLASLLMGCPLVRTEYVEVKVPVYQCPSIEIPSQPVYAIESLRQDDRENYDKIAKAYVSSLLQCKQHNAILMELLSNYED